MTDEAIERNVCGDKLGHSLEIVKRANNHQERWAKQMLYSTMVMTA